MQKINILPKNYRFLFFGAGALLVFLVMLFLEVKQVFVALDPAITKLFQTFFPTRSLDTLLSFFSLLGSFEIITLGVVAIALWVFRRQKKIFYSLVFFGGILMFEFMGKLFLYHPGPPSDFFRYSIPFAFPTSYVHTNYSFPSGHVSRTIFLAIVSVFVLRRWWASLMATVFSLVMVFSRIYLGEHWASDTLGGIFLGLAMGFFTLSYYEQRN
ncbi:phosphatase PAP2 family protein [Candidatus Gottesmanbacteria bacterium]|nr:phosphatase PAP2 family protein [Candidatus Gottesmanbacteria bacterium]